MAKEKNYKSIKWGPNWRIQYLVNWDSMIKLKKQESSIKGVRQKMRN